MQFTTLSLLTLAAGFASAADHAVMVGETGLSFSPDNITAVEGDTVTFHFYPKAHSVVQSAFTSPCEPLQNGFFSGFVPTSSGEGNKTFVYTVSSTKPVWFYCSQGSHCQAGMVGVINAPANSPNTIEAYTVLAKAASNNTTPTTTPGTGGKLVDASSSSSMNSTNSTSSYPNAASSLGGSAAKISSLFAVLVGASLYAF